MSAARPHHAACHELPRKHPRSTWKDPRRKYCDAGWWPRDGKMALFNPAVVRATATGARSSLPVATGRGRPGMTDSQRAGCGAKPHVRFGSAAQRNGLAVKPAPRSGPTSRADLAKISDATLAAPRPPGTYCPAPAQPLARSEPGPARRAAAEARSSPGRRPATQAPSPPLDSRRRAVGQRPLAGSPTGYRHQPGRSAGVLPV